MKQRPFLSGMRTIYALAAAALFTGCALKSQRPNSLFEDGIYRICSSEESAKAIRITTKTARTITVHLQAYTTYLPQRIVTFSAEPAENCWYIQIEGVAGGVNWLQDPLLVIAAGKAYYEIRKTGAATSDGTNQIELPAILSFKVLNASEADSVASNLRRHFSIK